MLAILQLGSRAYNALPTVSQARNAVSTLSQKAINTLVNHENVAAVGAAGIAGALGYKLDSAETGLIAGAISCVYVKYVAAQFDRVGLQRNNVELRNTNRNLQQILMISNEQTFQALNQAKFFSGQLTKAEEEMEKLEEEHEGSEQDVDRLCKENREYMMQRLADLNQIYSLSVAESSLKVKVVKETGKGLDGQLKLMQEKEDLKKNAKRQISLLDSHVEKLQETVNHLENELKDNSDIGRRRLASNRRILPQKE